MNYHFNYQSTGNQAVIMLMSALSDLGGIRSKREVIRYIARENFFQLAAEDIPPYPSVVTREPRWHTLIAFARKDCVVDGWFAGHDENDSWEITRDGLAKLDEWRNFFRTGRWDVRRCYIWRSGLKRRFQPDYQPSIKDTPRPKTIYKDSEPRHSQLDRLIALLNLNSNPEEIEAAVPVA